MSLSGTKIRIHAAASVLMTSPGLLTDTPPPTLVVGFDETLRLPECSVAWAAELTFEAAGCEATMDVVNGTVDPVSVPSDATPAYGSISVTGEVVAGTTLSLGGVTYTFSSTPGVGKILVEAGGSDLQASEIEAAINGTDGVNSAHPTIVVSARVDALLNIQARTAGNAGNSLTLAKAGAGASALSLSGSTLSGGTARVLGVRIKGGYGGTVNGESASSSETQLMILAVDGTNGSSLVLENPLRDLTNLTLPDGTRLVATSANGIPTEFTAVYGGDAPKFTSVGAGPTVLRIIGYSKKADS
jgi:hypothetical protein